MNLIFIALDKPDDDILLNEELFNEKYIFASEELSFESKFINDENFSNFLNFVFQTEVKINKVKESENRKLIDFSRYKGTHLHPDDFEKKYLEWLNISKNDNTMTEYGSFICVLGYLEINKKKDELYLIIE
ncbi:hypothetical protein [Chryseobacterium gregarium]|uniref:hypothetical protein n=1 Tax=Chryseobacterium gregarium TaxID=456299 RepID=UPI00041B6B9F|nr:hypothetical protein [Chryseobacterium gregarium]